MGVVITSLKDGTRICLLPNALRLSLEAMKMAPPNRLEDRVRLLEIADGLTAGAARQGKGMPRCC